LFNLLACCGVGLGFGVHRHRAQVEDRQRRRCLDAVATDMPRWIQTNVLSKEISVRVSLKLPTVFAQNRNSRHAIIYCCCPSHACAH
jgi:hypothetical protein